MDPEVDERVALKLWLHRRLTEGDRPREEWRRFLESTWEHLLATPVRALIDPDTAKAAADELMDTELNCGDLGYARGRRGARRDR